MRADEVKAVLESIGKRPSKRLGQNFLLDESVMRRQVGFADLGPSDTVLEIGPGLGNLTDEIVRSGAKVVAVEQDRDFCRFLERRFGDRIQLVCADAVRAFLPRFDKVVSNLPYQISSPIVFKLLGLGFDVAVLMLQKEFAERMVARSGTPEYGRLSVGVYYRADSDIVLDVPRHVFWPQPKVDSCVVRLVPKEPPFKVLDELVFSKVTQAIFSHRRKKISNSLKTDPSVSHLTSQMDSGALASLPYSTKRAEELTPEMIGELADALLTLSASSSRSSA
ncbi:MAG: ribosomal RNA small subunit methyltransferase A [Euryarchaeota archaeon RBG_16_62_10]|nr:MAG: ribosomal RNA small subunit methyltransferase A [Euryarchaeota archaeon RBG_16_62_10]